MIGVESSNRKLVKIRSLDYVNFSGANYLDLASNEIVVKASIAATEAYGLASDFGYDTATQPVASLEASAAKFFGTEDAIFSPSTYLAVSALVYTLAQSGTAILIDEKAHHTAFHAARVAQAPVYTYKHCDASDLRTKIAELDRRGGSNRPIILTDGVFPTFGQIAPLKSLLTVVRESNGILIVDDAHGTGVLGENGRGTVEHCGLVDGNVFFAAGMGKAIGVQGAIIPLTRLLAAEIKANNPVYGSVSLPVSGVAAAISASLNIAKDPGLRETLHHNKEYLVGKLNDAGIDFLAEGRAPVVSFSLGSLERNNAARDYLRNRGYLLHVSKYTAAPTDGVLRHALMVSHTRDDLDGLTRSYSDFIKAGL